MIISNIQNSARIEALHPLFKKLFDYVKENELLTHELGRINLDGDSLFINNVYLDAVDQNKQVLEIHKDYIDVHILLAGRETIGWKATEELTQEIKAYEKQGDCALYADKPTTFVDLQPSEFAIVYPEDSHAPAIGKGKIRKLIAKIKL